MKKNRLCYREDRWHRRKMFMIMKLFVLLTCCFTFTLSARTSAQQERVSVNLKDVSIQKLFDAIQQQTDLYFLFNMEQVQRLGNISVDVNNETVESVLNKVFKDSGLTYQFSGNMIIVRLVTTDDQKKSLLLKGWVYDTKKQPMPGVTIKVVGTTVGTATNKNGWFALQLPMLKGTLEFSFVGYKKQQINFTEKTDTLRIKMEEEVSGLDEVTVIAYGERNKREVVSSISSVKADEIKEIPTSNFVDLLQGRMAGVQVTSQSGAPGGGGTYVSIRGYNSLMNQDIPSSDGQPLYVVDGVPMHSFVSPVTGTNALAELDPSTIESVEVLKDAAAASLYGSRAGNGVVLITTKKGKVGKAEFSANVSYTASIMPRFPFQLAGRQERWWHILFKRNYKEPANGASGMYYPTSYQDAYENGGQYDEFWNAGQRSSGTNLMLQDSLNPFYNNQTNWWKQMFRTGKILNVNVAASGGTNAIRYMVGMGYYTENGIMFGSDFKRANFVANLSMKPAKRINFDTRFYLAYTDKSRNLQNGGALAQASKIESMTADPKRTSTLLPAGGAVENEILKKLNGTIVRNDNYRLMLNARVGIDLIEGLKFTASLGLDYTQDNSNVFEPSYLSNRGDNKSTGLINRNIGITEENLLTYTRNINDVHRFEVLLGLTYTENQDHGIKGQGIRGASDNIHYVDDNHPNTYPYESGVEVLKQYQSSFSEQVMISYLGRIAYNYKLKYLMEFTFRRDGSSAFGENVRYADFPAIAVGWSFGEEAFVKNWAHWLNIGKIRGSWGTSGQTLSDPYLAHGLVQVGNTFMGNQGAFAPMINKDLSWEKSDQYDVGLDLEMFNYRLKFKLDYYYKYTKSLLYNVTLPGDVLGNTEQWQNAMEISNQGLELEVVGDIIRGKNWSWRTRFNISRNWNCFEKSYTGMDVDRLVIGRPLNGIYLYDDSGIYQNKNEVPMYTTSGGNKVALGTSPRSGKQSIYTAGMRVIKDIDGNGYIDDGDLYYAGSALPLASGGWANEVKWKNFDLNVLFTFTLGRKMINQYAQNSLYDRDPAYTDYRDYSFWGKEGDNTEMSAVGFADMDDVRSRLEKVNYMRLKTLSLGYNVPSKVLTKVGLSGVRVFFTGENLLLWDNYSGLDPEVVNMSTGNDNLSSYPLSRKFTLGLTVKF